MRSYQNGSTTMVVLLAIGLLVAGGVYYVLASNDDNDGNSVAEEITQQQLDTANSDRSRLLNDGGYPALYLQYGLPEYPEAAMTYDGRTDDSLSVGISLTLSTSDDVQTVGAFYQSAFNALPEWTFTPPKITHDMLYGATASKPDEGLRYQLIITRLPDYTQINISFLKP